MTIKEKFDAAVKRQQTILDAAKTGKRDLTDEESASLDALQTEIDGLKAQMNEEEKAAAVTNAVTTAVEGERKRISDISAMCRDFGIDPGDYISKGDTVDTARAAVLELLKKGKAPLPTAHVEKDEEDKFRAAAADGLMIRSGSAPEKPAEGAKEFSGMSLRDLAIECLSREGGSLKDLLKKSADDLFRELSRAFFSPTAAFPAILDTAIDKSIVTAYAKVPTTFQEWTAKGSVNDFKATPEHSYVLGGIGDYELVPENGELKHSSASTELLPQRKIDTYGKQFSMSRQAFINDDIGFLSAMPAAYAGAAKRTIDKAVYKILFSNPAIYDGTAMFHATHKNLISSGAAPSQATVQAAILQLQKQTDQFGDPIYITPEYIIVPLGYEFALKVLFGSMYVPGSGNNDINPLYNSSLKIIQTPVLNALAGASACPWFLIANKASAKSIQVDYLKGQETPMFRRSETPGQLGFVWDTWLDWGITAVDFRGAVKNPGAVV